ncbi:proline permease [Clostridiales bacterium PH28_bin88]|nr:proline permease [Clostridiales bacterium PH28_bin88]
MQTSPIVVGAAVIYFIIIFGIGYFTRKASLNPMDYYVAGRKVGSFVNGAALAATYLSPASFLGLPAFIFIMGYPFWWALIGIIGGMPLASMLTAAPLRKYAPISFTDYYADRYESDKAMRIVAGLPVLVSGWAYVVLSLVGTALFMMAILKIPYQYAVIIGAIAVLFYVYLGGMVSTTWATAFQGILMAVAAVAAALAILVKFGGFAGLGDAVYANNPNFWLAPGAVPGKASHPVMSIWTGMVSFYFVWHFGFATMPYTVVRFFTAMDLKSARRAVAWCTLIGGAMYWGLIIIGTSARMVIETLHPLMTQLGAKNAVDLLGKIKGLYNVGGVAVTDYSMVSAVEALNNPWLLGLLVAGGLAIAMSTASGWVMVLNVMIGRDWMGKVFGSKWAIDNPVKSMRVWSVIIIIIGTVFAFNPIALVLDLSGWAFVTIIATTGAPMILGIWWPRATKAAAFSTILVFLPLTFFSWLYAKNALGSPHWFFLSQKPNLIPVGHQMYWIPVAFIFFIIVSLLTKPCSQETVQKYCNDLH